MGCVVQLCEGEQRSAVYARDAGGIDGNGLDDARFIGSLIFGLETRSSVLASIVATGWETVAKSFTGPNGPWHTGYLGSTLFAGKK